MVHEPGRRRIEVSAAAVAVHEQFLARRQAQVVGLVERRQPVGDDDLTCGEVAGGVDPGAREGTGAEDDVARVLFQRMNPAIS
jgi:hypothetical protein